MSKQEGQDNWLTNWVGQRKVFHHEVNHKAFHDEDDQRDEPPSNLFKEINALRKPQPDNPDAEAIERAKYSDGLIGQIATSKVFEFSTLGMICFNALAIGYDADYTARWGMPGNLYECPIGFIIIENTFALYFTTEVLIRFLAYKKKSSCLTDAWFVFDSILVTMMVAETWILPFLGSGGPLSQLSIFRLLRLLRITRISRLMRAVPEMMVIIKGMVAATRTVVCTGALLMLVLYTFCILFTDAYHEKAVPEGEEEPEIEIIFGTMGKSMFSLFIFGTILDDVTYCSNAIRETENTWMLIAFIIFILISSFMMLNMLIGILVEVVGATAEGEKEKAIESHVREAIGHIFATMDKDENHAVSRGEFLAMRNDKQVMEALSELDIVSTHFQMYAELFFRPEDNGGELPSLSYDKLASTILRLRPGSFVSALDFAMFAKTITGIHDRVKDRVLRLENLCQELSSEMEDDVTRLDANATEVGTPRSALPPLALTQGPSGDPVTVFNSEREVVQNSTLINSDRERLGRTASTDIIEELQRRLGVNDLELDKITGASHSLTDKELQNRFQVATEQPAEAFMTLGVPQDWNDNDSETVYV